MGMDPDLPDLNDNPITASLERVSGLNSFMGSSDATGISVTDAIPISHLSMRDRLMMAKSSREGPSGEKKSHVEVKGAAKDIEKPKRGKKVTHASVAASIEELEKHDLVLEKKTETRSYKDGRQNQCDICGWRISC
jgi:hypothetical protein